MIRSKTTDASFWNGKRVLVTGHTGFKGSWLVLWLNMLGADVVGISLPSITQPNLFSLAKVEKLCESYFCDIRNTKEINKLINKVRPEILIHLAAQPLVRVGYRTPIETFETNVQGTVNVLDALRSLDSAKVVVAVTTDKVYENHELHPWPYREIDSLCGHDPYSASKAAAEFVVACYRDSYLGNNGIAVASARAGNVIGGGDWSEDRLIPDAVRAWQKGAVLHVRRPEAIRPWQHVLEPLGGYLCLAQSLWREANLAGAYNFGPPTHEAVTVREVVELARSEYGEGKVVYGDGSKGPHEAERLLLEIAKARTVLGFSPRWSLMEAVRRTMTWYRNHQDGMDARIACQADLDAFGLESYEPIHDS